MKWHVYTQEGGRYAVYDLQNAGSEDRGHSVKIEGFDAGNVFIGGVSIYPSDAHLRDKKDAEDWHRRRLFRICVGDKSYAARLLDYVVDVRCGNIPPETRPPVPPGGWIALVPDDTTGVYLCGADRLVDRIPISPSIEEGQSDEPTIG